MKYSFSAIQSNVRAHPYQSAKIKIYTHRWQRQQQQHDGRMHSGCSVEQKWTHNKQRLCCCCTRSHFECVQLILSRGARSHLAALSFGSTDRSWLSERVWARRSEAKRIVFGYGISVCGFWAQIMHFNVRSGFCCLDWQTLLAFASFTTSLTLPFSRFRVCNDDTTPCLCIWLRVCNTQCVLFSLSLAPCVFLRRVYQVVSCFHLSRATAKWESEPRIQIKRREIKCNNQTNIQYAATNQFHRLLLLWLLFLFVYSRLNWKRARLWI